MEQLATQTSNSVWQSKHTFLHDLKEVNTGNCDSDLLFSSEENRELSL